MVPTVQLKAMTFRAYVTVLQRQGILDAVHARVRPATQALLTAPPLPSSWMDFTAMIEMTEALEAIGGLPLVRDIGRRGTTEARKPYMTVVEGVLKLFGTSPATLFKRMNTLVASFIRGIDFEFTPEGERAGAMSVAFQPAWPNVPLCAFVGQIPTFQALFDSCGAPGSVGQPERLSPHQARFALHW